VRIGVELGGGETQPSGPGPGQMSRGATVNRPHALADSRRSPRNATTRH
jgi:hypothetical protein